MAVSLIEGEYTPDPNDPNATLSYVQCEYQNPNFLATIRMFSDAAKAAKEDEKFLNQMKSMSSLNTNGLSDFGGGGATWGDSRNAGGYFRYGNIIVSISAESLDQVKQAAGVFVNHYDSLQ